MYIIVIIYIHFHSLKRGIHIHIEQFTDCRRHDTVTKFHGNNIVRCQPFMIFFDGILYIFCDFQTSIKIVEEKMP